MKLRYYAEADATADESTAGGAKETVPETDSDDGDGEETRIPDPTRRTLDAELFTGGALDVDRLSAGPLEVTDFVGDTLATILVDADLGWMETDSRDTDDDTERGGSGRDGVRPRHDDRLSGAEQQIVSTYLWVLSELDDRDTLRTVLEEVYTERVGFYRQYVDVLLADGQEDRAREAIEDGLDEFSRSADIHRLAVEFHEGRDGERYRELLQTLFVRFEDWDAYDELQAACSDDEWESVFHGIVTQLGRLGRGRLIDLYVYEDDREKAFEKVLDSENLDTLRSYRGNVADVDPDRYFETYRDLLEPYLAAETGRDHYRTVIDHLREMEKLGFEEELASFVSRLREKHSNRPAFLDELDKAGY